MVSFIASRPRGAGLNCSYNKFLYNLKSLPSVSALVKKAKKQILTKIELDSHCGLTLAALSNGNGIRAQNSSGRISMKDKIAPDLVQAVPK